MIKPITTLFTLALLVGCSATPQTNALLRDTPTHIPQRYELSDVPFNPQEQYQCGPAALATVLDYTGVDVTPEVLKPQIYVPSRKGSFQVEMLAATRRHNRLAYPLEPSLEALMSAIAQGFPVLVLQNLGMDWYPRWHYAVAIGYDLPAEKIILRSGITERYAADMQVFERTWARGEHWGMLTLQPGTLPSDAEAEPYFLAAAAFENTGSQSAVARAWQAGLERWPRHRQLLMGYGNFLYTKGEPDKALPLYRRVTEHHPHYAPGFNNLAQALIDTGQPSAAIAPAKRAVALSSFQQRALFTDTLRTAQESN